MACAVAAVPTIASILEPSGDFPAWLEAQGVNAEVAQAMDSELGIRDYGVLRACVGDGLVRAELLATARDRLPFGFYAVLRQVVKALQGAEPCDSGTMARWDATAASSHGDLTLASLVDVLLALFSNLSRELLLSMRRLGGGDGGDCGDGSGNGGDGGIFSRDSPPEPERLTPDYRVANEDDGTASVKDEYSGYDATAVFTNTEHRLPTQMDNHNHLSEKTRQTPTTVADRSSYNGVAHNIKLETFEGDESRAVSGGEGCNHLRWEETGAHGSGTARTMANSGFQLAGKLLDKPSPDHVNQDGHTRRELLVPHLNQFDSQWRQQQEPQDQMIDDGDITTDCVAANTTTNPRLPASWRAAVITAAARRRSREPGIGIIGTGGGGGVGVGRSGGRRFECAQCGRRFTRSEALVFHMRTHTGERPYCCDVCGRAFSLHSNLKVHQRTHTGERPHRCDVCGRGFTHRSSWKRHQRMHDRIYMMQQLPTTAPPTMQSMAQCQQEHDGAIEHS